MVNFIPFSEFPSFETFWVLNLRYKSKGKERRGREQLVILPPSYVI